MVDCQMNVFGSCKDCPGIVMRRDEALHYITQATNTDNIQQSGAKQNEIKQALANVSTELQVMKAAVVPGHTTFKYLSGSIYSGEVDASGAKHGLGTLQDAGSDHYYYTGQWVHNVRQGHGVQTNFYGLYTGQFVDDQFDGSGTQVSRLGTKYVGEFKSGTKHGWGKKCCPSGDVYIGEFAHGEYCGRGTYKYANGDQYSGEFVNGQRNRLGVFVCADGSKYTGEWNDNMRHGSGVMQYGSGEVYDGQWVV
eukprot:gene503-673_t